MTEIFDDSVSNFSPLTMDIGLAVSEAKHAARVMIDEDGCTGAAYTLITIGNCSRMRERSIVSPNFYVFMRTYNALNRAR